MKFNVVICIYLFGLYITNLIRTWSPNLIRNRNLTNKWFGFFIFIFYFFSKIVYGPKNGLDRPNSEMGWEWKKGAWDLRKLFHQPHETEFFSNLFPQWFWFFWQNNPTLTNFFLLFFPYAKQNKMKKYGGFW